MSANSNYFEILNLNSYIRLNPKYIPKHILKSHPTYQPIRGTTHQEKALGALVLKEKFTKGAIKSIKLNLA
jgi:hypothetical protein